MWLGEWIALQGGSFGVVNSKQVSTFLTSILLLVLGSTYEAQKPEQE